MSEPLTWKEEAELRAAHRPCDCNRSKGLDASGQRVSDPDPHCIRRTGSIGSHGRVIEPWCEADRLLATLDAARAARPSLDLATLLKDDVRALAHLTPEQWDERRGLDPIARTINAVFDIIDARFATPATSSGAAASPGDSLDVDEVAARFHDARYGVLGVHDGTGSPPFVDPVVACGYCRRAAERYVYAAQRRLAAAPREERP